MSCNLWNILAKPTLKPFTYIKAATFYSILHLQVLVAVSKIVSFSLYPVSCSFKGFHSKSPSQVLRKSDISFKVSGFLSFFSVFSSFLGL